MKSFKQYLIEETNEIVFAFGRFNPPTAGHEKLIEKVASVARGNQYRIYASQSNDSEKNPLKHAEKVKFMRKMFSKHGRQIMADTDIKNALDICTKLYDQGFTKVTMVCGSDRLREFNVLLNKYNGTKSRHGFYNFENGISVVSAGQRDPDAEGVEGMSASKLRAYASTNNFAKFSEGMPDGFKGSQDLFNAIRKGMGLKESYNFKTHIKLRTVSEEREQFVEGTLFEPGDMVVIKESSEIGTIKHLGANYVIIEMGPNRTLRKWITDIERLER